MKSITNLILLFTLHSLLSTNSIAQDSWSDSWKLTWSYDPDLVNIHNIIAFDIYKGANSPTVSFYKSVDASQRSSRDYAIQPNTNYYYRLTVRDDSSRYSNLSPIATEAIPYIYPAMDVLYMKSDTSFFLNDPSLMIDKDLTEAQYADSLNWWINDGLTFSNSGQDLSIALINNTAEITVGDGWAGPDTVWFTVFDPDSFWYKKQTILKYGNPIVTTILQDTSLTYNTDFSLYPVPFRAAEHQGITFENMPLSASVFVYNVLGEPIFTRHKIPTRTWQWNVKNNAGRDVNAGLYIYHVLDAKGNKKASGKLVVVR